MPQIDSQTRIARAYLKGASISPIVVVGSTVAYGGCGRKKLQQVPDEREQKARPDGGVSVVKVGEARERRTPGSERAWWQLGWQKLAILSIHVVP